MRRPVVGIIGNSHLVNDQYEVQGVGLMNLDAVSLVADAVPVIIPALPTIGSVEEVVSICDGFVLTGGRPNVHPKHYGEEATEAHGQFDLDRDALTLPLIRECVARSIPILGICRGFQEFNVAFGGTLHPEIRDLPG
ncbi:MAG: gamma-glutamyl-gamma-aminobutyrate hydrolase family protein, partial [Rhodobacteraceae bacterium]|nr:gamma-glutamyl-gamma-aminobutyrate hydrolase family protein [Paracoccaceae bacterium]